MSTELMIDVIKSTMVVVVVDLRFVLLIWFSPSGMLIRVLNIFVTLVVDIGKAVLVVAMEMVEIVMYMAFGQNLFYQSLLKKILMTSGMMVS